MLRFPKFFKSSSAPRNPDYLEPDFLLSAYIMGMFPMAIPEEGDEIYWFSPDPRAILPLNAFHIPHDLKRIYYRKKPFDLRVNTAFEEVIRACANTEKRLSDPERKTTWISERIIQAYTRLHRLGFAHSVESWQDGELVGGLYGVALGGAFFGESMFSYVSEASKVALVYLVERLNARGFRLLDVQYQTAHLARFGAIEIPKKDYMKRLEHALNQQNSYFDQPPPLQSSTLSLEI
ncbi:MAG: leucyl/phenylalanyl-tRNA--protein transferase [Gemmatimonadetes bacterium]|nr:MAG: leucyl/phenylalanyl-tRNA--protein transferase [Gemmatimonadota bacterium]